MVDAWTHPPVELHRLRVRRDDVIDWIEMIPFSETRNYVQRVMESVAVYRRRLGKPAGPTLESDLKRWARRTAAATP